MEGVRNAELGDEFRHLLLMAFRERHYRRGPHGERLEPTWRPFIRRTEETREAVARRLEFFVSLPHGRGRRDRAKNETAQHFNVDRRTIERDLEKAARALKTIAVRQNTVQSRLARHALRILEGHEDKSMFQSIEESKWREEESKRREMASALCGLLSMSL